MAVFDFPRINLRGTFSVNVATANNDSLTPGIESTYISDSDRVEAVAAGMTDDEFRAFATGLDSMGLLRCQWNYYGDMSLRLLDVSVCAVQLGYDRLLTTRAEDSLIGGSVSFKEALLCDANPEGFDTTQVFASAFELRAPGALGGGGVFLSRAPGRATTRWLDWYRNVSYHGSLGDATSGGAGGASAVFQHAIVVRPEDLKPVNRGVAAEQTVLHKLLPGTGSPGISALLNALRLPHARGLLLRYSLYLAYPRISDPDLAAAFAAGRHTANPAIGKLSGTLVPWFEGDAETIPMGRMLRAAAPFVNPYRARTDQKPYYLAPAVARVDQAGGHLSIDANNTFPEDGPDGFKWNMGTVTIGLRAATAPDTDPGTNRAPVTDIGVLPNDRDTYEQRAGLYDVSLDGLTAEQRGWLGDGSHELVVSTSLHGVLLYEPACMVATDCGCAYLDELAPGESWTDAPVRRRLAGRPAALRGEIPLLLRRRGEVPAGKVTITVEQWKMTPTGDPAKPGAYNYPILLAKDRVTFTDGVCTFPLVPLAGPGLKLFRFVPDGQFPAEVAGDTLATTLFEESFSTLRVLPYDDYSQLRDDELTFDVIYREVFRYYALIFPAMNRRLDMSDPTLWETPSAARYLLRVTDPGLWETPVYMPRTRDLSAARRLLLERFCHKVLAAWPEPVR